MHKSRFLMTLAEPVRSKTYVLQKLSPKENQLHSPFRGGDGVSFHRAWRPLSLSRPELLSVLTTGDMWDFARVTGGPAANCIASTRHDPCDPGRVATGQNEPPRNKPGQQPIFFDRDVRLPGWL